jgi:hypothetical protein
MKMATAPEEYNTEEQRSVTRFFFGWTKGFSKKGYLKRSVSRLRWDVSAA